MFTDPQSPSSVDAVAAGAGVGVGDIGAVGVAVIAGVAVGVEVFVMFLSINNISYIIYFLSLIP